MGQLGVPEVDCWTLLDAIGTIGLLRGRISRICRPRSSVSHRTAVGFAWVVAGFSHMFILSCRDEKNLREEFARITLEPDVTVEIVLRCRS